MRPSPSGRHIGAMCRRGNPLPPPGHPAQTVSPGGGSVEGWLSPYGRVGLQRHHTGDPVGSPSVAAGALPAGGRVCEVGWGRGRDQCLAAAPTAGRLSRSPLQRGVWPGGVWCSPFGRRLGPRRRRGVTPAGVRGPNVGGLENEPITGQGDVTTLVGWPTGRGVRTDMEACRLASQPLEPGLPQRGSTQVQAGPRVVLSGIQNINELERKIIQMFASFKRTGPSTQRNINLKVANPCVFVDLHRGGPRLTTRLLKVALLDSKRCCLLTSMPLKL